MEQQMSVTAKDTGAMADVLEAEHADDVWRSAAAQHLRAAERFLTSAEADDERRRQEAETAEAAERERQEHSED